MTSEDAKLIFHSLRKGIWEIIVPPKTTANKETVDRPRRRTVEGVVTGDKMDKTIKVQIDRFVKHPMFEKTLKRSYVCFAHDEKREAHAGDKVEIMETRPLSKLKTWRLLRVIQKAASGVSDAREAGRPAGPSASGAKA